jgi:soluble lytic murein transglycosylase-like protein
VVPDASLIAAARDAASRYGVDPDIFQRMINQESGFNPAARSPAGAIGIAQFMPQTARGFGIDPLDPMQSLDAAARYIKNGLSQFNGSYPLALAAYNAGAGAVRKYNGIPPYRETQNYVKTILGALTPNTAAPAGAAPIPSSSAVAAQPPSNAMALALMSLLGGNTKITPFDELIKGPFG